MDISHSTKQSFLKAKKTKVYTQKVHPLSFYLLRYNLVFEILYYVYILFNHTPAYIKTCFWTYFVIKAK